MKELRPYVLILMGIICGLVWGGACGGGTVGNTVSLYRASRVSGPSYALLTYDLPSGSQGGSNTSLVWTTTPLNSKVYDPAGIVSLSANQFTLGAGTYLLEAGQSIFENLDIQKSFRGRLVDVNAGTTVAVSLNVRLHEGPNESATVVCPIPRTLITLAAPATFELQYFCQSTDANTVALGFPMSTGEVERNAFVSIQQIN